MSSSSSPLLTTPLSRLLNVRHPILLAGMDRITTPELVAAVANAGGFGVIGGGLMSPAILRKDIRDMKELLRDDLKHGKVGFGVDLLLPQVGGGARKTNYDYTHGQLDQLIDVVIEEKATLFVSAIGVPPPRVVERLHKAGILIMNMVGHPKHVPKALAAGVDLICAQAGEGGGHTGDVPASILIPACVDAAKGKKSPLTGEQVLVVAGGAVKDGKTMAAYLMYGAAGVWVGTRLVACQESGAPKAHKELLLKASIDSIVRTPVFTGRPLNALQTPYLEEWHTTRSAEMADLLSKGIVPRDYDIERDPKTLTRAPPWFMGRVAGLIDDLPKAGEIVQGMARECVETLKEKNRMISAKL